MKSKMKRQRQTELPRVIVGALATAGASVASGATVQITFANNYVANTANGGLTNFNGDMTGDGTNEIFGNYGAKSAKLLWNPGIASAAEVFVGFGDWAKVQIGNFNSTGPGSKNARSTVGVIFTDSRINSGVFTNGWLDVEATSIAGGLKKMQIHRLIFDDASTTAPSGVGYAVPAYTEWSAVPEPSSLALLALGAGGLLARRRRAA